MNGNILKMLLRSIRATFGRYMAILAIVALGVGFFAGLKSSEPAMSGTAHDYLEQQRMYDFQLMSSLGLTDGDVQAFNELEYVKYAEGGYTLDVLLQRDEKQEAFKFLSITDEVCVPVLIEGRMPENAGECLVDSLFFTSEDIGSKIRIAPGNEQETLDMLRYGSYTIVGIAKTPRFISVERGSTHLGSGSISGFVLLTEEGFDSDVYHELLVCAELPYTAFSDEYDAARDAMEGDIKAFLNQRGALRYKELKAEADQEIADARKELDEGWQEYEDGKQEARDELADAAAQLRESQEQLDYGLGQIDAYQKQIDDAYVQIPLGIADIDRQLEQNALDQTALQTKMADFAARKTAAIAPLEEAVKDKQAAVDQYTGVEGKEEQLKAARDELEAAKTALSAKEAEFASEEGQLQIEAYTLSATEQALKENRKMLSDNYAGLPSQQAELDANRAYLEASQYDINSGWEDYYEAVEEVEKELADAFKELEDGEQELLDAIAEIDEELQLDLYTLTRDENSGCATFKNDVSIVDAIANVFPVFFALIAALVCSTTMTRMVTEERTQIGTLKAMGYSSGAIMSKYLLYSGSSAFLGCVAGFALGVTVIPYIVWIAYNILYDYAKLEFYYDLTMCLSCLAVAVLGTLLVTWYACRRELSAKPAELIRPKVEGRGKRVFIEYIKPLWKRLSFLNKVTIRNALRYKSRVFMMLLGIGGCTALLVAGFGVRDSVVNVLGDQYEKIFLYDLSVKYEPEDFSAQDDVEKLWSGQADCVLTYQAEATLTNTVDEKTARLIAAQPGSLEGMIELFNDEGSIPCPGEGQAVLSTRVSQQLELEAGDSIRVTTDDGLDRELLITAICENYVGNYIYVSPETVDDQPNNTAILSVREGVDAAALGAKLRSEEGISYVSIMAQEQEMMAESMASLDMVVLLLIVCSGALAFITLYNLTNINLLERIREVATVKVLGFYPKETASYILRENVMLSFLGAAVGMLMGKIFHGFVISLLQVEGMCFGDEVAPLSYALGFVMTIVFAWLCNLAMRGKLEKVNMTESLKSVE